MAPPAEVVQAVAILQRTPAVLTALLDGLGEDWTRANEGPETFSPHDVVGHLIDGEETGWIPRARIILTAEGSTLPAFDRFRHYQRNAGRPLRDLLQEFDARRAESLATLQAWALTPTDLDRTGEHPALGTVTLRHLLATWVTHDFTHLSQITRVMASQYRNAVGPWAAYLSILRDRTPQTD